VLLDGGGLSRFLFGGSVCGNSGFFGCELNPADALTQVSHICTADTMPDERSASIVVVMVIVLMVVVVVVVMSEIPAG